MRKKSHLSLAGYIVDVVDADMIDHPLAFRFGSLEPDLVPSFITTKHRIDLTFHKLEKKINKVIDEYDKNKGMTIGLSKDLGVITHYIADYFTYPHNSHYPGNIKDHCHYENHLKHGLRAYIRSGEAVFGGAGYKRSFSTTDEMLEYIQEAHEEYMKQPGSVENDCKYITTVCSRVLASMPQFAEVPVMAYAG